MQDHVITEGFLKALDRYFSGEAENAREAAKEAGLSGPNRFLEILKEAYRRGYVTIRSPVDPRLCEKFRQWVGLSLKLEAYIVKGRPDHRTFSLKSAEVFLIYLKRLLTNDRVAEINIGIVSGSTTALLVDALVTSPLWDEVLTEAVVAEKVRNKTITVIGLTANPVKGWELQGDANMCAYRLAVLLREKLVANHPDNQNKVEPWGITNSFVVMQSPSQPSQEPPAFDRSVLEVTDPGRLTKAGGHDSKLDIVITGIGGRDSSLFTEIMSKEKIEVPRNAVGDCAYVPIDEMGKELRLTKKDGNTYSLYSAIQLPILGALVETGKTVILVARNARVAATGPVDKTRVIRATIRGKYANVICTDEETAEKVMADPI
jgi:DNA-binding transcriptional regulator LsrR (DeoR family)